jgi:two-component system, cell cycle response regulator
MNHTVPDNQVPDLLVVDDTAANLQLLTSLLREQGYKVRAALDGPLALEAVAQSPPDLILLDIKMPGMDGFEVCAELKRQSGSRDIPIIFISAQDDPQDKVRAFEAGGMDYITKPFQEAEVLVRVRTHLNLVQATRALREREELSSSLLESTAEGILGVDIEGKAIFVNPAAAGLFGYTPDELIGQPIHKKIHYAYADGTPYKEEDCPMMRAIHEKRPMRVDNEHLWHKNGSCFPVTYSSTPVHRDEEVIGAVIAFTDITELRQTEVELRRLLVTDQLTEIYNRKHLDEMLASEVGRSMRYGTVFSVIMVDIDKFKSVNDSYGHQVGDEMLKAMVAILQDRVRTTDTLGRWGGEEFMVICPETGLKNAKRLAEQLRAAVASTEFPIVGEKTASFGVATYRNGEKGEEVMKRADNALFQAKEDGRNRVVVDGRR